MQPRACSTLTTTTYWQAKAYTFRGACTRSEVFLLQAYLESGGGGGGRGRGSLALGFLQLGAPRLRFRQLPLKARLRVKRGLIRAVQPWEREAGRVRGEEKNNFVQPRQT